MCVCVCLVQRVASEQQQQAPERRRRRARATPRASSARTGSSCSARRWRSTPIVRPWKAFSAAMIFGRPVRRAILNAASSPAAPEFAKSTLPGWPSSSSRRSASSSGGSVMYRFDVWPRVPICQVAGLNHRRVRVAKGVDRDAAEQVEVAVPVGVPHLGARSAHEGERWGAVVVHHRGLPPRGRIRHQGTTIVPTPSDVNTSSSTECGTHPSITWARGTPPRTARGRPSSSAPCRWPGRAARAPAPPR